MNSYKKLIIGVGLFAQLVVYGAASQCVASQCAVAPVTPATQATVKQFDANANDEMYDAIRKSDIERLQKVLATSRVTINFSSENQVTALGEAFFVLTSDENKVAMIALLLNYGADLSQKDHPTLGRLPIYLSTSIYGSGSAALVNLVLSWDKSYLNIQDKNKCTPLMYVINTIGDGKPSEVMMNLMGADKEQKYFSEKKARGMSIIEALLSHGADISTLLNHEGKNALEIAAEIGNPDVIKVLDKHNYEIKKKLVNYIRENNSCLFYFPPGLLPLVVNYIQ